MYPGYTGDLDVEGSVSLNLFSESAVIHYDVTGVDAACENGPTTGKKLETCQIYCGYLSYFNFVYFVFLDANSWARKKI